MIDNLFEGVERPPNDMRTTTETMRANHVIARGRAHAFRVHAQSWRHVLSGLSMARLFVESVLVIHHIWHTAVDLFRSDDRRYHV